MCPSREVPLYIIATKTMVLVCTVSTSSFQIAIRYCNNFRVSICGKSNYTKDQSNRFFSAAYADLQWIKHHNKMFKCLNTIFQQAYILCMPTSSSLNLPTETNESWLTHLLSAVATGTYIYKNCTLQSRVLKC